MEFCFRARRAGHRVLYTPRAVLVHLESQSQSRFSSRFIYRNTRGRLRFVLKNFSLRQVLTAIRYELKWWPKADWRQFLFPMCRAYAATLVRLPIILHDRNHRRISLEQRRD